MVSNTSTVLLCQGIEALVGLAKDPWNLRKLRITMHIDSPLSENVCFSLPLLSFSNGSWSSIVELVRTLARICLRSQLVTLARTCLLT